MKPIPVDHTEYGDWITYGGKVLLLKPDSNGNGGDWQWQGTMCRQNSLTGFIAAEFVSRSKYFNEDFWYKKTSWMDDEGLLFFITPSFTKSAKITDDEMYDLLLSEKKFKTLRNIIRPYSRPVANVMKTILREASRKTGLKIDFWDDIEYGNHWGEAYVPVIVNDEKMVLTWMNCD
jgi:hypothetical protein